MLCFAKRTWRAALQAGPHPNREASLSGPLEGENILGKGAQGGVLDGLKGARAV